jgi:hypothetical protein
LEGNKGARNTICVQCENSPPLAKPETAVVNFTLSFDGTFTDCDVLDYQYYKPVHVTAIKPHHGPKDGGTTVQIWGEGFMDYGDDSRCSIGVKTSPATIINDKYATCQAPSSDVVGRPMPFAISLNGQ